jgi:hypothetical protein
VTATTAAPPLRRWVSTALKVSVVSPLRETATRMAPLATCGTTSVPSQISEAGRPRAGWPCRRESAAAARLK